MIEVDVGVAAGAFAPIVALPFTPAFALAFALAFVLAFTALALALALAFVYLLPLPFPPALTLTLALPFALALALALTLALAVLVVVTAVGRATAVVPALLLARSAASVATEADTIGGRRISSADLRGYVGKNAPDTFKKEGSAVVTSASLIGAPGGAVAAAVVCGVAVLP